MFHHNPTERVSNKYKRPNFFLLYRQFFAHLLWWTLAEVYLGLFSFVHQTAKQALSVIDHVRRRFSEGCGSVIAKGHDTSIGNLLGKEVFQPERVRFWVGPGVDGIASESMHSDNARTMPS